MDLLCNLRLVFFVTNFSFLFIYGLFANFFLLFQFVQFCLLILFFLLFIFVQLCLLLLLLQDFLGRLGLLLVFLFFLQLVQLIFLCLHLLAFVCSSFLGFFIGHCQRKICEHFCAVSAEDKARAEVASIVLATEYRG